MPTPFITFVKLILFYSAFRNTFIEKLCINFIFYLNLGTKYRKRPAMPRKMVTS